jgi:hypothetical protein
MPVLEAFRCPSAKPPEPIGCVIHILANKTLASPLHQANDRFFFPSLA